MSTDDSIEDQFQLLATHRETLEILLRQQAMHSSAFTPPSVMHGISDARDEIKRIKLFLRGRGVSVEDEPSDQPYDSERSADIPSAGSTSANPASTVAPLLAADRDAAVLERTIAAMEAQRAILGDEVVDTALVALRMQLAAAPEPVEQQRKQVSILFADVSGFTALSERLDPEDITEIINALWERLDAVVYSRGGRVDKHIGDALMALWGAGATREDDPEQAVRAALDLQQALADFRQERDLKIAMRVGINTGIALIGPVGSTRESTAMGDAVNIASRLEHAAPVGGILISHDTYRHIRGLFDVQAQPPLSVKGKEKPLQTYIVSAVKPRAFWMPTRGVEGVETRMVGRENDMGRLREAYHDAVEGGETRLVTVIGDAGVGKSRLLSEFQQWLDLSPETTWLLRGRAIPETLRYAGGLLRDILSFRCQVSDTDTVEEVRAKLASGLAPILDPGQAAILGQAAGFDFADLPGVQSAISSANFTTIASTYLETYLRGLSETAPTVLLLEDLHWADDRSLDLLDLTLSRLTMRRLLVVAMVRPALFERRPDWGSGQPHNIELELRPLSARYSRELVEEILQRAGEVPQPLRDTIVTQAEGNPFYIEELIKTLIDQGVIVVQDDAPWIVHLEQLEAVSVPATLAGVLQARLDSLPVQERDTLQCAAVVGREFWDAAVVAVGGEEEGVAGSLDQLRERELVFRHERSAFTGTREYVFKHALLHEVTYQSVLKRTRRLHHQRAALWLEQKAGARIEEYAALIADHYARAEDRPAEGRWQARAGMHAAAQHANQEATRRLTLALDLLPAEGDAQLRGQTLLRLGQVHDLMSEWAAAGERYQQALDYALRIGGTDVEAACLLALGNLSRRQSKFAEAQRWLERASARARELGDIAREVQALASMGEVSRSQSDFAAADRIYQACLSLVRPEHADPASRAALASTHKAMGTLAAQRGDLETARQHYLEGESLLRALDDRPNRAAILNNLGTVAMHQGDYADAKRLFTEGLELFQQSGDRYAIGVLLNNLGLIANYQGDAQQSRSYFEQAIALRRQLGDRWGVASSLSGLTNMLLHTGVADGVWPMLVESLTINHELEDRVASAYCLEDFAGLAALLGDNERALRLAGAAAALRARIDSPLHAGEQAALDKLLRPAREALADPDAMLRAGSALDVAAAVALALASD